MLGNFSCFDHLLQTFLILTVSGTLSECQTICLDPDQDQHFVGPDLGPNCLQRLTAGDKSETT